MNVETGLLNAVTIMVDRKMVFGEMRIHAVRPCDVFSQMDSELNSFWKYPFLKHTERLFLIIFSEKTSTSLRGVKY